MSWNSEQYLKFANERKQPCTDLLARLNGKYDRILDLGCGPGNSTENLFAKFGNAEIIGFDSDDNMLEKARHDHPDFKFVKGFAPDDFCKLDGKFDLVFSNACIHWIPNQEKLIDEVYDLLSEQGVFAVQIPLTDQSHFYKILYGLIEEKWIKLKSVHNFHHLSHDGYYNTLSKHFKKISIWQSDYYHVVDRTMVLEWYKGSGLRPYLALLNKNERQEFLNDLQNTINAEYPLLTDGNVFLVMPRLFFVAEK